MTIASRTEPRLGPVLPDGTPVASLVDVERRTASLRLLSDPDVFRAEQEHLFARSWNLLAHESEVPNAGDYVTRQIAGDPVIVSRGRDGDISVMLNVCTHRGMQVCRSEVGNASSFKCPYHGWVFGGDGNLLGAPFEREMYGTDLDKANLGLRTTRVATYAGLVFANWDRSAPPLDEFLGDFAFYLDTMYRRSKNGLEAIGAPQRFHIGANWKIPSEQFNGADGYHVATLHRTLVERMMPGADAAAIQAAIRGLLFGVDVGSRLGHGVRTVARTAAVRTSLTTFDDARIIDLTAGALASLASDPPDGTPPELVHELRSHLTDDQIRLLATFPPNPGGMFANIGYVRTNIHTHNPLGARQFEMMHWVLVERDAPAEYKAALRKSVLLQFGTSGVIEQDDCESWPSIQKAATGYMGSQEHMRNQAFVGHKPPDDWPGGALVYDGFSKDDCHWNWWLRYRDYMTGNPF
ncbi:MAG: (2Fe-2S)-binding protein [Ilumatobacteraceae bacterium]|nr:(2Fe-2S)-binding protein [Ilumatobacteraceae bacterium]